MALGILALYIASFWSYYQTFLCTGTCPTSPARTGVPILTAGQMLLLVALAFLPMLALASRRWPSRLVTRSGTTVVMFSAFATQALPPKLVGGALAAHGPLPWWVWPTMIPVGWLGGLLVWLGLDGPVRAGTRSPRPRGPVHEAVWAGVVGVALTSLVLFPSAGVRWTVAVVLAGVVVTLLLTMGRLARPKVARWLVVPASKP